MCVSVCILLIKAYGKKMINYGHLSAILPLCLIDLVDFTLCIFGDYTVNHRLKYVSIYVYMYIYLFLDKSGLKLCKWECISTSDY